MFGVDVQLEEYYYNNTLNTWVVGNDFAHVVRAATGTTAGGRPKAPWNKRRFNLVKQLHG